MKRIIAASLLLLTACNNLTIGVAVAAIGTAGAGLEAYCAASAGNCTPGEVGLGIAVVAEAVNEEATLLSGAATSVVIAQSVANLTTLLTQAKILPQNGEVLGIEAAIQVAIPLIQALVAANTTVQPSGLIVRTVTVITIRLTAKDRAKLKAMDAKIAAVRH